MQKMSDPDVEAGQEPLRTTIPRASDAPTIASATQTSLESFQSYNAYANSIKYPEASLLEDQGARFTAWAANNMALGKGRDSLDHRSRRAPNDQENLMGVLEALVLNLANCECPPTQSSYLSSPP